MYNRELDHTVIRLHVENTQKEKQIVELMQVIEEQYEKINGLLKVKKSLEESNTQKVILTS